MFRKDGELPKIDLSDLGALSAASDGGEQFDEAYGEISRDDPVIKLVRCLGAEDAPELTPEASERIWVKIEEGIQNLDNRSKFQKIGDYIGQKAIAISNYPHSV